MFDVLKTRIKRFFEGSPKLNRNERKNLYRGMSNRMVEGISAVETWKLMLEISEARLAKNSALRRQFSRKNKVIAALKTAIDRAKRSATLDVALLGFVPDTDILQLRAGVRANVVASTCMRLCESIDRESSMLWTIIGAIAYPILIGVMLCGMVVMYATKILPPFESIQAIEKWPLEPLFVLHLGTFIASWWWLIIAGLIGAGVLAMALLHSYTGRGRVFIDSIPPFNFYRIQKASGFAESFHTLIAAEIPTKDALQFLSDSGSPWMQSRVRAITTLFATGEPKTLAAAMDATGHSFPDDGYIDALILSGSQTDLAAQVAAVNKDWTAEVQLKIKFIGAIVFYTGLGLGITGIALINDVLSGFTNN